MSTIVALFLKTHLLLALSALLLLAVTYLNRVNISRTSSVFRLRLGYGLISVSLLSPLIFNSMPAAETETNSASETKVMEKSSSPIMNSVIIEFEEPRPLVSSQTLYMAFFASACLALLLLLKELFLLARQVRESRVYRTFGRVVVATTPRDTIPASFAWGTKGYILLPYRIFGDPEILQLCIKHEAQHLRQYDTAWIYLLYIVEKFFVLNPLAYVLCRHIKSLQELACDEAVVRRKKISAKNYATALLNFSVSFQGIRTAPGLSLGIAEKTKLSLLKERIKTLSALKTLKSRPILGAGILGVAIGATAITAYNTRFFSLPEPNVAPVATVKNEKIPKGNIKLYLDILVRKADGTEIVSQPTVVAQLGSEAELTQMSAEGEGFKFRIKPEMLDKQTLRFKTSYSRLKTFKGQSWKDFTLEGSKNEAFMHGAYEASSRETVVFQITPVDNFDIDKYVAGGPLSGPARLIRLRKIEF